MNVQWQAIEYLNPEQIPDLPSTHECIVLHFLSTKGVSTFNEYAYKVFIPYINKRLQSCMRIDIAWDRYIPDSLKESTRKKRGKGVCSKVLGDTKFSSNWIDFLHDPSNKNELFVRNTFEYSFLQTELSMLQ